MKYYSQTTNGFYIPEIHTTMPNDVVEITDEQWQSLLDNQSNGTPITPETVNALKGVA